MKKFLSLLLAFVMVISIFAVAPITASAATYNFLFPVNNGGRIGYIYGYSSEYFDGTVFHNGIDLHSNGDKNVYAAEGGTVIKTANDCGHTGEKCVHYNDYGNCIKIKHSNGTISIYGHLLQHSLRVKVGDTVTKGQAIATIGSSGYSTGPHLHFEVRLSDGSTKVNVNPTSNGGSVNYSYSGYNGTHTTHSYNTYAYYGASHPHYKYYKCTCGDVQMSSETTYVSSCAQCNMPSNVWIQASDDLISPGESIEFTFGATNANKFTIGIDKDGTRIITETISSGRKYTFEEEGTYTAYVTASGAGGSTDSQKVYFSVYQIVDLGHSFYAEITRTWGNTALTDDNRNLALYTNTHAENQLWRFTRQSDGSYMIYNVASRGYIDLAHSSATNHTNVQVIIKHDVNAQHWYIFKTDVGYSLATKCGVDWRLDVADNGTSEGTNVQVYKFHNHAAQKFYINKVDRIAFNTNETEEDILVLPIHNVNGSRDNGYNVIYTYEWGTETNTNIYGAEKAFDLNGKLVETRGYGVETKLSIPTYGFVLSMNSRSANLDKAMSEEYQYAYYDAENNSIELYKNESDYQQRKLKHLIGSKSFFKDDVYVLQATNVDELRGVGATVIYTSNYGADTATNMYGNEISFDSEGKLVGNREWGNTTPLEIPSRGFAISEHSGGSGYQTILSENYQFGYCNFEQKAVILFKNKEDFELGKRLFCAQNQSYGELPVPVRDGFTFDGWYTQPDGGEKVDSATLYTGAKELYAHWKPNATTILGDVDGDKKVSIMDATEIQRHIAQLSTIPEDRLPCADTYKDGKITILDATQIQRFIAQLIPEL